jgi:hypothetical protein
MTVYCRYLPPVFNIQNASENVRIINQHLNKAFIMIFMKFKYVILFHGALTVVIRPAALKLSLLLEDLWSHYVFLGRENPRTRPLLGLVIQHGQRHRWLCWKLQNALLFQVCQRQRREGMGEWPGRSLRVSFRPVTLPKNKRWRRSTTNLAVGSLRRTHTTDTDKGHRSSSRVVVLSCYYAGTLIDNVITHDGWSSMAILTLIIVCRRRS